MHCFGLVSYHDLCPRLEKYASIEISEKGVSNSVDRKHL